MDGMSLTLNQGYPSRSSEAGGLQKDQFVKHRRNGMDSTATRIDWPDLCHSGTVTLQNLTVHTAE